MDIPHGLGNTATGNKLLVLTDIRWEMIGPLFSYCVDQLLWSMVVLIETPSGMSLRVDQPQSNLSVSEWALKVVGGFLFEGYCTQYCSKMDKNTENKDALSQ